MNDCISNNSYLNNSIVPTSVAQNAYFVGKTTVYEVIRIIDSCPLFIEDHLDRLQKSATLLNVQLWLSVSQIQSKIAEFIKHESIEIGNLKLQFTFDGDNSFFLLYQSRHSYPTLEMYKEGVTTKTLKIERENPNAKNIQSFHSIAQTFIAENNLYEAILVDKDENITEGSKSNIFFLKNNTIITAFASDVLLGITRKYVMQAAQLLNIKIEERKIALHELQIFDAAFISGTSPKILPIKNIDANVFETNNVLLEQLMSKLDSLMLQYIEIQNIRKR